MRNYRFLVRNLFRATCVLTLLAQAQSGSAATDPRIDWRVLTTPHFEILYDANHQAVAKVYAEAAERAHSLLAPQFNNDAPKRTVIVLDDSTDSANGFATPIPRSLIGVYPVLPDSLDFLSYYADWSQEMMTHEYTHILNFEPANGFWSPLRFVFGSIIRPNALLPRWYLEGLAVQMETQFTHFGRLRSPLYRAVVRAGVQDQVWGQENLGHAAEVSIPTWPMGSRPYFYGALIWNDLVAQSDLNTVGKFNERYAGRVPYFLDGPMLDTFNKSFDDFFKDTIARHKKIAQNHLAKIQAPTDSPKWYSDMGDYFLQHSPRISPHGDMLLFVNRTIEKYDELYLVRRNASQSFSASKPERLLSGQESMSRPAWFPDGKKIAFATQSDFERYYSFSELKFYDLETKKTKSLLKGARARDPIVSPDGASIYFVQNLTSATRLVRLNIDSKNVDVLYEPGLQVRISTPEFIDSDRLMFSERKLDGHEVLREIRISSKQVRTLLENPNPILGAHLTKQGIVFASYSSGINNLYLASTDFKKIHPITNTATHIFNGTIDPVTSEVITSRLDSEGGHISSFPLSQAPKQVATIDTNEGYKWTPFQEPARETVDLNSTEEYSAVSYLFPQYWWPILFAGPYATSYGASISAQDPLLKHAYTVSGTYDNLTRKPGYGVNYMNGQTPVTLLFAGSDQSLYVESVGKANRYLSLIGLGSFYIYGLSNDYRGLLGWDYFANQFPNEPFSVQQGPVAGMSFDNISMRGRQISPVRGVRAQALYTQYLPNNGNVAYSRYSGEYVQFLNYYLPQYHALRAQIRGTYTPKNRTILEGTQTGGGEYVSSSVTAPFTVRGYAPGSFLGWSFLTTSLEYRMPIEYTYRGFGTNPWFIKRTHGAVFWDTLSTEGAYYDLNSKRMEWTHFGKFYSGVGAEFRIDTTLFYMAPITFRIGYHYGLDTYAQGGGGIYLGIVVPEI